MGKKGKLALAIVVIAVITAYFVVASNRTLTLLVLSVIPEEFRGTAYEVLKFGRVAVGRVVFIPENYVEVVYENETYGKYILYPMTFNEFQKGLSQGKIPKGDWNVYNWMLAMKGWYDETCEEYHMCRGYIDKEYMMKLVAGEKTLAFTVSMMRKYKPKAMKNFALIWFKPDGTAELEYFTDPEKPYERILEKSKQKPVIMFHDSYEGLFPLKMYMVLSEWARKYQNLQFLVVYHEEGPPTYEIIFKVCPPDEIEECKYIEVLGVIWVFWKGELYGYITTERYIIPKLPRPMIVPPNAKVPDDYYPCLDKLNRLAG